MQPKKAARISTYPYFCGTLEQQHIFYYYYYYYFLFIYIYQVLTTLPLLSTLPKTPLFRTIRKVSTWNNHGTLEQNSASFSFTPFYVISPSFVQIPQKAQLATPSRHNFIY
jgi:hypothetical protein